MVKKGNGGVTASRGYEYQDYAALDAFLRNCNKTEFIKMNFEGENDFTIINKNNKEISGQAKSYAETLPQITKVINELPEGKNRYLIYLSYVNNKAKIFIEALEQKQKKGEAINSEWIKNNLSEIKKESIDKVKKCQFEFIPYNGRENYVKGTLESYIEKKNIAVRLNDLEERLIYLCYKGRSVKGSIAESDLLSSIDKEKRINVDFTKTINSVDNLQGFKADINNFIDTLKNNSDLLTLRAEINSNNIDAVKLIDILAKDNPKYEILSAAIHLLFNQKDVVDVQYYSPAESSFNNLVKGMINFKLENFQEALNHFKAIEKTSLKTNIDLLVGLTEYNLNDFNKAVEDLSQAKISGDTEVTSIAWCAIYLCKIGQDPLYNSVNELEEAHRTDPDNFLASMMLMDQYTFLGRFDDAVTLFNGIKLKNITTSQKIKLYLLLLIAQETTKDYRLRETMIEFINLVITKFPQKSIGVLYMGAHYTKGYTIIYDKDFYSLSAGKEVVKIRGIKNNKFGLGIGLLPSWSAVNKLFYDNVNISISNETFVEKFGYPLIVIYDETISNIERALKSKGIIINHLGETNATIRTDEYIATPQSDISITLNFYDYFTTGYIKIGGYAAEINIPRKEGTKKFESFLSRKKDILLLFEDKDKNSVIQTYIEIPKKLVHIHKY